MTLARPLSADELREQLRAETRLAKLDLFDDLAELHDTAMTERERQAFAERYRDYVGVLPARRAMFRLALEKILAGDGSTVAQVVASSQS
jgi:hypothetical protein